MTLLGTTFKRSTAQTVLYLNNFLGVQVRVETSPDNHGLDYLWVDSATLPRGFQLTELKAAVKAYSWGFRHGGLSPFSFS